MIPWMREKFAERRARWLAARKRQEESDESCPTSSCPTPEASRVLLRQTEANGQQNAGINGRSQSLLGVNRTPCLTTNTTTTTIASISAPVTPQRKRNDASRARINSLRSRHCNSASVSSQQSANNSLNLEAPENLVATKERIRIRVICPSARVLAFQVDTTKRLTELKSQVLVELRDDGASMPSNGIDDFRQLSSRYRLVRAEFQGTELNELMTFGQLEMRNNDALVLVLRRTTPNNFLTTRDMKGPTQQEIEQATQHIMPKFSQTPLVDVNEIFQQTNIQFDVRKVLISLAQAAAAVIGAGPYATRLIATLKQKLINKRNFQQDTQQCLVDMGFTEEQAEYALRLHNGVYPAALEFLIQHQKDAPSDDRPMPLQKSSSMLSPSGIITNDDIVQNTSALLEIVRIYSHRDIPPTPDTVEALTEMGFAEADVMVALKKTCNNKAAACEWLCGNRTGSLIELRDGLAPDSPILKTILDLPQVQMNLSNPKILLAFLSILENENSIRIWGGDNDTTSVITHILQKYHEEKHVLGINQFYSNRN